MRTLLAMLILTVLSASPAAAQGLKFSGEPSAARDVAERLMEAEMGEDIESAYVTVAEVDIDFDGRPEIFAFADWTYFCGSAGCVPRLYADTDAGWVEVEFGTDSFINSAPEMWSLDPEPINGHVVFVLTKTASVSRFDFVSGGYIERSN